ncbi:MAG: hypothetical protein F6K47_42825 [Symploca sp. SIO2E6]|nr:hypothetical protein [Symploca sp. SIO2E6]
MVELIPTQQPETEVKFTIVITDVSEKVRLEAHKKAKEAYVMTLLRYHNISAGRAAELLEIDRWQLSDLMSSYDISPFDDSMTLESFQQEIIQAKYDLEQSKK